MKNVMSILKSGVGFLLLAVLITVTVLYFNRGKDVATQHADNVLNIAEGINIDAVDLTSYDGKTIKGSSAISILESLVNSNADVPVLVFTNGGNSVAEYTKSGASSTEDFTYAAGTYKLNNDSNKSYELTTTEKNKVSAASEVNGNYRNKTDVSYINPSEEYKVTCHYTSNEALAFVTIIQQ